MELRDINKSIKEMVLLKITFFKQKWDDIEDKTKLVALKYIIIGCMVSSVLMVLFLFPIRIVSVFDTGDFGSPFVLSAGLAVFFLVLTTVLLVIALYCYWISGKVLDRVKESKTKEKIFLDEDE